MTDKPTTIVYGGKAISREIGEPDLRKTYYKLESGYVPGAFKAGERTWGLVVPTFREALGRDWPTHNRKKAST